MHVYICVHGHVCVQVCMHVCMHVCIHAYVCKHVHVHLLRIHGGSFLLSPPLPPLSLTLVQPGFYTVNWLLLGKTLLALREREKAKQWLTMAAQLESVLIEDLEVCDII